MSDHDQPDRYGPEPKTPHWCATCRGHTGPDSPCYEGSDDPDDALSTQPAVPLQPLTDSQIHAVRDSFGDEPVGLVAFARAIEKAVHLAACAGGGVTQPLTEDARMRKVFEDSYNMAVARLMLAACFIPASLRDKYEAAWEAKRTELRSHGIVEPARGDVLACGQMKKDVSGTEGGGK